MAFEPGNQAAAKGRKVEKMLERALMQDEDRRLRLGVEKVLDLFAAGEKWAVEFVADRLDGKPTQQSEVKLSGQVNFLAALQSINTGRDQGEAPVPEE